ncbi:hypothetical protein GCM10022261_24150 [Brevibacterium daeguense]|uniref:Uncharacterized protein n=1 Tax=Brevibacterium daeguense TaxID=909936 RepID=A0ABP8ELN6_9MICO|nr:hypothetical protein [Brevibacterium daeguense]
MSVSDPGERPIETPGLTGNKNEFDDSPESRAAVDAGMNQQQDAELAEAADGEAEAYQSDPRIFGSPEAAPGVRVDADEAQADDAKNVAESIRDED